ncbi:D-aminoacyl-tRNA deacylase [Thermanaerovibrio acidaminovorans]|jgi:D-tyrosyl-tRNA(Tyr) deacylase|uniref:D-aminoacyl-tRNA deacylase n=1 Tax=Thermanaerovibrio acidaminovorans (strain ATCC 49978 / DSM 6589 / Su883) TaxID=525903 RepID=D1B603_THEAS|nr:D-aminoacyl-tRNA deacylase [Thermanaerovibrio acidaminovorans]ACZ19444.1 D-tyrosyl-tRNA(Tyr) deacylase [Thermanaerovibrio acidaminovorans DSM 6589]
MRVVLQRVSRASVSVDHQVVGQIGPGVCLLVGFSPRDAMDQVNWMADKVVNLRIFEDEKGKLNLSLLDVEGEVLVVSQFTLYGDCVKGRRPSFTDAAPPDVAVELYDAFVEALRARVPVVRTGVFGAHMEVELVNHGPVTLIIESTGRVSG